MSFRTKSKSESGSAAVELLGFGVLLQIPILLFATSLAQIQHRSFAVESISRNAIRSFVLLQDLDHTRTVIEELATSFSIEPSKLLWRIECSPDISCRSAGGTVLISISYLGQEAIGYSAY